MISFFHLQRFKDNDIEVKRKDGIILLRELAAEVKNFMDFKRNAVMVSENLRFFPPTSKRWRVFEYHELDNAFLRAQKVFKIWIHLS